MTPRPRVKLSGALGKPQYFQWVMRDKAFHSMGFCASLCAFPMGKAPRGGRPCFGGN
ncbi:hypothetical protein MTBSS4_40014 [Magnetospirillum sp. SS-4]|nr:hypothetical protein MTBSS4_40014 [Magnetospirillum sp. SS-4]